MFDVVGGVGRGEGGKGGGNEWWRNGVSEGCVGLLSHISFFSSESRYEISPINAFFCIYPKRIVILNIFCDFISYFTGPNSSVVRRRPLREWEIVVSNPGRHTKDVNIHTGSSLC